MSTKIVELLGYEDSRQTGGGSISRYYYIRPGPGEANDPEKLAVEFRAFAQNEYQAFLAGMPNRRGEYELGEIEFREEKDSARLYLGTLTLTASRVRTDCGNGIYELFGETVTVGRDASTRERRFKVAATSAQEARSKFEAYIKAGTPGRLHIDTINVEESDDASGWYSCRVSYAKPEEKIGTGDARGIIPIYGDNMVWDVRENTLEYQQPYVLRGFSSIADALIAVRTSGLLSSRTRRVSIHEDTTGEETNYSVDIEHSNTPDPDKAGSIRFSISGTQVKSMIGVRRLGCYTKDGSINDPYGGLIGVTKDGVEGVDLDVYNGTFSITRKFPASWFHWDNYRLINLAAGRFNGLPWNGFAVGEVRFLGAEGDWQSDGDYGEMTFNFATSPNSSDLFVGDIGPIAKRGWDYLNVEYAEFVENGRTFKRPTLVTVDQVYLEMDFAILGL